MSSYNYDKWGEAVPSQAGYIPERSVTGYDLGTDDFSAPADIFYANDDIFYIVDSGNNRIVAVDSDLKNTVKIYDRFILSDGSETYLKNPTGIFVSDYIYIADSENSRILVSDKECNVVYEITKPDSPIYDQEKTFIPQKVIADKAGNIYTVISNISTGAAVFSNNGDFMGFYGSDNAAEINDIISDFFVSDEKRARRSRNIPTAITDFDISGDFIFTCTASRTDSIKKLNAAGNNIFSADDLTFGDYNPVYSTSQNTLPVSEIIDVDISDDGYINCLDRTECHIFQYDEDCNLIFVFGGSGRQVGNFQQVSAIESAYNNIYVLDSMKNNITVFALTDFGSVVHEAVGLYNDGFYSEALEPWQEVLRLDGNYTYAYKGVASALLRQGDYKNAMNYAELANAQDIYNKAFEGYRREFIGSHFGFIFSLICSLIIILIFLRKFRRKNEKS